MLLYSYSYRGLHNISVSTRCAFGEVPEAAEELRRDAREARRRGAVARGPRRGGQPGLGLGVS